MKIDLNRLCRLCGEPEYAHDDGECPLIGYNEWIVAEDTDDIADDSSEDDTDT